MCVVKFWIFCCSAVCLFVYLFSPLFLFCSNLANTMQVYLGQLSAALEWPQTVPLKTKLNWVISNLSSCWLCFWKHFKITFAREWGSPQIMEDNFAIRDFPLRCRGPSANSWCLAWLAQRPQDLRHIYAALLPGSALLSKYLSHISGMQHSSWASCPFKLGFYWTFAQFACSSNGKACFVSFYCQLASHGVSLDAFMQTATGSFKIR